MDILMTGYSEWMRDIPITVYSELIIDILMSGYSEWIF